jgi:hypothetical protein
MSWQLKQERIHCPDHYQDRLTRAGGANRYGNPNFIIVFSQSWVERRAGINGKYEDYLPDFAAPCWVLKQWEEEPASPAAWYFAMYDDCSGLSLAGEYPFKGRYKTLFAFRTTEMVNGRLEVQTLPLNSLLLAVAIPVILRAHNATAFEKRRVLAEAKAKANQDRVDQIEGRLRDAAPVFIGAVSYRGQTNRSSVVQQKMDTISRTWDQTMKNARNITRGITTRSF